MKRDHIYFFLLLFYRNSDILSHINYILFYYFLGAHAVGRCHTDRSGFWGPWTHAESTLSNEYYRLMFEEKWTPKKTHNGQEWKGPPQFENKDGDLMMLSTG